MGLSSGPSVAIFIEYTDIFQNKTHMYNFVMFMT
jgi:hypothetical protein